LAKYTIAKSEYKLLLALANTIKANCSSIFEATNTAFQILKTPSDSYLILQYSSLLLSKSYFDLWSALKFPHQIPLWEIIYNLLVLLSRFTEQFILPITHPSLPPYIKSFCPAKYTHSLSVRDQVATHPVQILDPYQLSLTKNYYFPLCNEMIDEEMTTDPAETAPQRDEERSNTSPQIILPELVQTPSMT
jgi:hypothetical protein